MHGSVPSDEERRGLNLADAGIEIRDVEGGGESSQRYTGYAAVFNTRTAIGNPLTWGFYEQIADGAFTKTLTEGDARMLIDHDSYYVVSRVSAGTLYLAQDQRGLNADSALDTTLSYVNDLKANVRNRNITGMSFGFRVTKDDWAEVEIETNDGNSAAVELRTIREVKLIETSPVTFPAYEETTAGLRHSIVPALLRRNDQTAIARAARYRPDLAPYLGYDEDLARAVIDLAPAGTNYADTIQDMIRKRCPDAAFEFASTDSTNVPASEPAEPTRDKGCITEVAASVEEVEPAASTRHAPPRLMAVEAQMRILRARHKLPAA
jgi:HK97 family phage prohead protease